MIQTLSVQPQQHQVQQAQMSLMMQNLISTLTTQTAVQAGPVERWSTQTQASSVASSASMPPMVASVSIPNAEQTPMVMLSTGRIDMEAGTWSEPQANKQREKLQLTKVSQDRVLQNKVGRGISVYSEL